MATHLSELIEQAVACLEKFGSSPGTIRTYRHSAFRPLERRLAGQEYVDSALLYLQEPFFTEQYENNTISKRTFNWRIRGIRMLAEIYDTGDFIWKVFSKKQKTDLPESFHSVLDSFMLTQCCAQKRRGCIESICRRFLLSSAENGITMITFGYCLRLHAAGITMYTSAYQRMKPCVSWKALTEQQETESGILLQCHWRQQAACAQAILNVFVRHQAPFMGYHDGGSIACIFRKYQKKCGIAHTIGDGNTLHGIRRGLGTEMASNGIPVDVVAQVLGHKGTKATKQYISTDLRSMRRCVLGFDSLGGDGHEPS